MPDEVNHIKEKLQAVSELFLQTVSVERIKEIAESAEELESEEIAIKETGIESYGDIGHVKAVSDSRPTIAVAKDEAFCFYYADNIRLWRNMGQI